ncbi:MAG: iron chelate uptake ABC transporter family permease subunit [Desulfobacteraceae bacterium]|nr:iron chelate uptake ABC transporter family permease subunit [Desulfobacteraceae bacterium]
MTYLYKIFDKRPIRVSYFLLLAFLLVLAIIFSTGMGYLNISAIDVMKIMVARISGDGNLLKGVNNIFPYVILEVRLPRILTSAIVGAGLSISGVIFQGILLNPLADPYTLGVSAGAAFGASVAIILNISFLGAYSIQLFAFLGAIGTLIAVIYLSSFEGRASSNSLILSGVIVAAILSAGISFLKYVADEQVSIIIFWLMGSFASETWADVSFTMIFVLAGFLISFFFARDLNIISLGDRAAHSLGVSSDRVRMILLVTASFIAAVCVSVSGIIGFVGLVVPHLMRFFTGADNKVLLPASGLAGAILLLSADTITRAVLPREVPIGVITAIIGGPLFCYILKKRGKRVVNV